MNTWRTYWLCQLLGWGGYSVTGLLIAAQYVGWQPAMMAGYALFSAYSIALTHALRGIIRRRGWLRAPARQAVPPLALAVLTIALIQTFLVVAIDVVLHRGRTPLAQPAFVMSLFPSATAAVTIWVLLYWGLTAKRRQAQMQLGLREAELRALESQINPHFLFNCLNSIRALVVEDPARAQDMLTRLANILRYNLHRDLDHTVPLSSEIGVVEDYLALEAVRFEDRLRVSFEIDPAAGTAAVPPMLLQTLVENAVKHGVAPRPAGGELWIRATREPDRVLVEVENTGDLVETATGRPQLGLANTRERLRLLYGDRARFELKHRPGTVAAVVEIPVVS
jgi:hypothetical protein